MSRKDMKPLLKKLRQQGFEVTVTGSNHYKVRGPKGVVFLPSSPSDHRSLRNCRKQLVEIGFEWTG
jgi:biotin operon repressor